MTMVAVAVGGSAVLGAVVASNAASTGASAMQNAANTASNTQLNMFNQEQQNIAPYLRSGTNALSQLNYEMGLGGPVQQSPSYYQPPPTMPAPPTYQQSGGQTYGSLYLPSGGVQPNGTYNPSTSAVTDQTAASTYLPGSAGYQPQPAQQVQQPSYNPTGVAGSLNAPFTMNDFHQDPGYNFQLNQGLGAMQRSAAAKGMLSSVGTQQNLNNYAQGMANTDYQQALQNFTANQERRYNMLSGIAGMGNTANSTIAQVGMNTANNISANQIGAGNASAAGQVGSANAIAGGVSGLANGYMNSQMMSNLFGKTPVSNPGSGGFNASSTLGQNMGPLAGGSYSPTPSYLGVGSLTE